MIALPLLLLCVLYANQGVFAGLMFIASGVGGTLSAPNTSGCSAGNRNIPMGYGDVFGDWREEAWWLCDNNTELRVYLPTTVTEHRLYTPMQDPEYRTSIGCMTMGYVQSSQTSYYMGEDMAAPPTPRIAHSFFGRPRNLPTGGQELIHPAPTLSNA